MSGSGKFTRGLAAVLCAAALFPLVAAAAEPGFREVRVDMSAVRATGDRDTADTFSRVLPGLVAQALAGSYAPGDRAAPILLVRVTSAYYGPIRSWYHLGPSATDFVEGVAVVVAGGRQIASYPLKASNDVMPNRDDVTVASERARVEGLAAALARWTPSEMGR